MKYAVVTGLVIFLTFFLISPRGESVEIGAVVVNEIGWMGTEASSSDEWIELYNTSESDIDLTGWEIVTLDGVLVELSGTIPSRGFFLLERTDDQTVSNLPADQIYTGALSNTGEKLVLQDSTANQIDVIDGTEGGWPAGIAPAEDPQSWGSMERIDPSVGGTDGNWSRGSDCLNEARDAGGLIIRGSPARCNCSSVCDGGTLKWAFTGSVGGTAGSPVIVDNSVFVGSYDNKIYGFSSDGGSLLASSDLGSFPHGLSADSEGTIYAGMAYSNPYAGGSVIAYDTSTGTVLWTLDQPDNAVYIPPIIDEENKFLFYSDYGGKLFSYNLLLQEELFNFEVGITFFSSLALDPSNFLYLGAGDGNLYAFDWNTGQIQWQYLTGGPISSSPAISNEGTVYFGSNDDYVYGLSPTGQLQWKFLTGDDVKSSPALGPAGEVVVGSNDGNVYCFKGGPLGDGEQRVNWRFQTGGKVQSSPTIGDNGVVYVGSGDGYLYALNLSDGTLRWKIDLKAEIRDGSALSSQGTVYITTYCGDLYAVRTGSSGLAHSGWPTFQGDNRRTGKKSTNSPPLADFSFSPSSPVAGEGVVFTDKSFDEEGEIAGWYWEFGDGTTSDERNPEHDYARPGDYTVTLTVTDEDGEESSTTDEVEVNNNPPVADFDYAVSESAGEFLVSFSDSSSDPDGSIELWQWDFGDGDGSEEREPSHVYSTEGYYEVSLLVEDDCGGLDETMETVFLSGTEDDEGDEGTENSNPSVRLEGPEEGLVIRSSYEINWQASDAEDGENLPLKLEYSSTGGSTWHSIVGETENDGSHVWDLREIENGDNFLIRITVIDTAGNVAQDLSGLFSVFDPLFPEELIIHGPNPVPKGGCAFWFNFSPGDLKGEIMIYDSSGRLRVAKVVDTSLTRFPEAGFWIPVDHKGRKLSAGIYLYLLLVRRTDGTTVKSEIRKMVIDR